MTNHARQSVNCELLWKKRTNTGEARKQRSEKAEQTPEQIPLALTSSFETQIAVFHFLPGIIDTSYLSLLSHLSLPLPHHFLSSNSQPLNPHTNQTCLPTTEPATAVPPNGPPPSTRTPPATSSVTATPARSCPAAPTP